MRYMEITENTRTYAQDGDSELYIITNDPDVTFETVTEFTKGCIVKTGKKVIGPELPIFALARWSPDWDLPDRQIPPEELKTYTPEG